MPAKTKTIILAIAILVLLTCSCIDLDWDGVEYDPVATYQVSGPAEEGAYATATATALEREGR